MKSVCYMRPGVELVDLPEPQITKPTQVKVKVAYASICGSDIHTIKGEADGHWEAIGYKKGMPIPLGHEASGVVAELGPEATTKGLKVGDKVTYYYNYYCGNCYFCRNGQEQFCLNVITDSCGAMSEYMVLEEQQVFKLSDDVDLARACLIEPISVCMHGIDLARIKIGDKVAISGGGGTGLLMLQLAKLSGASKLTLIEPVEEKRNLALKLGAEYVYSPFDEDLIDKCMRNTDGLGFDVVIETSGATSACDTSYSILSRGGTLEFFAIYPPSYAFSINLLEFWQKEAKIISVFQSPYMFPRAIATLDKINTDIYIENQFSPDEPMKAFEAHLSGRPVKVMFKF
jgi:threonine dehydrogenase-like Zn-dependent dehydrogenase